MNEVLIRKAKKGDKDAFCRLMDENVQSMYKIAAAYLKNDEELEAFKKANVGKKYIVGRMKGYKVVWPLSTFPLIRGVA